MTWVDGISWALAVLGGVVAVNQCRIWWDDWHKSRIDRFSAIERHGLEVMNRIKRAGYVPDVVLGLGRSGAFLGGWLAGNLGSLRIEVIDRVHKEGNVQLMDFPQMRERLEFLKEAYGPKANVLVVEGATTRGTTFYQFEQVRASVVPDWNCKFCVLYEVDTNMFEIDFVGKRLKSAPLRYPWHATEEYRKFIRRTRSLDA
jgi:hypoxanthine phosphoribosyltransferase